MQILGIKPRISTAKSGLKPKVKSMLGYEGKKKEAEASLEYVHV
jgi:hypothetical protein